MATTFELPVRQNMYHAADLETASIHSAAPSYLSEAPSYHTTVSASETIPDYTPPARNNNANALPPRSHARRLNSAPALLTPDSTHPTSRGLPPIPSNPRRQILDEEPTLAAFAYPTWSRISTNPTYERVASRRARAASKAGDLQRVLDKVNEEEAVANGTIPVALKQVEGEREPLRPLEDPYLVGEVAARRAREERLARENGTEVLVQEDRRWDWFLAQMNDWEERDQSWKQFKKRVEGTPKGKLARRIGSGLRF